MIQYALNEFGLGGGPGPKNQFPYCFLLKQTDRLFSLGTDNT